MNKSIRCTVVMKKNSVLKNTAWIIGCRIIQSLFSLVIGMLTARFLGPSNYGVISYAASVVAFAAPIMKLGLNHVLVNEILNNPEREGEILGTTILLNLMSAIACIIGVSIFGVVAAPDEPTTRWVCVLYSINLLFQATEMVQYWFQAKQISQYTSIVSLVAYILVSGYKMYLLITKKDVCWFAISQSLDYLIITILLIVIYCRIGGQKFKFSFSCGRRMLNKSKHFIVSSMMITVFSQTDKIMLKMMLSSETVGIYTAAVICAGVSSFVFAAIIDSVRPVVFENKIKSRTAYEESLVMCYSIVIFLSLIQSVIFTIFAKYIILLLYGVEYLESISILRLVVWYTTFSYIGSVRSIWILAENKQKYLWIMNLSGAGANVLFNAILIPFMGAMGAALASLVTQFFTNVVIGFIIKPIRYNNKLLLRGCNPKLLLSYAKMYTRNKF